VRPTLVVLLCLLAALAAAPAPGLAQTSDPAGVSDAAAALQAQWSPSAQGGLVSAAATGAPVATLLPVITGLARRGQTLSSTPGSWSPGAQSYAYQWQRDTGSGMTDIAGATTSTYVLVTADIGATVGVHVTATNASGPGTADASAVGPVSDAIPAATVAPAISGGTTGGKTLTVALGTWSPAGTSYAVQWQRDTGSGFTTIAGATGTTYTTVPADVSATLRATVTATNSYGSTAADSAIYGPVTSGAPASTSAPTLTGVATRGRPLAVNAGAWSPAGTTYAFRWQRDAGSGFNDIAGATATSYTPGATDLAATLRVVVTAANVFGTATATSNVTAPVATDPPVNSGSPALSGTAKRTFTLTAAPGSWSPSGATFAYQWQSDDGTGYADISGATGAQYTLAAADVGATVRVQVTATNADGSATAASAPTPVVVAATPTGTVAPVLSGAARLGTTLTTSNGGWSPAATSYAYQWQRLSAGTFSDISGETSQTYTLAAADVGTTVRAQVTATNADGSTTAASLPSATVASPPVAPASIAAPTGTLLDTGVLAADPGTWSPAATTFTFQWLRCPSGATAVSSSCVTVSGSSTYSLVGEDVGHAMAVRITGRASGLVAAVNSALTTDVQGRALTNLTAPGILGTVQVAEVVRAVPGSWSVPPRVVKYQWQRCDPDGTNCADVTGAAAQSYSVTVADRGHALVVRETAVSPGHTASAGSAFAVVADQPAPVSLTAPVISGIAARAVNLQATVGTWANKPTGITYAWQRCDSSGGSCAPIGGAISNNYILGPGDVGATITVAVTARNTAGPTTVNAPVTAVIAAVLPQVRAAPSVSGKPQVPNVLQAVRTQFKTTTDTRYAYRWQRCDASGSACVDIPGATTQSLRLTPADARVTVRVLHTATNADGSVAGVSAPTAVIKPAAPALMRAPRIATSGYAAVGKAATIVPGLWNATTEITGKVLEFWRCNPSCALLATGGAGSYTLTDADAGALIRGAETATGPGGTYVAWAPAWVGPVRSAAAASGLAVNGATTHLRTSSGALLATARAGGASTARAAAAAVAAPTAARTGTVRITVRRAANARGTLRAWACVAKPRATDTHPCTKAVALGHRVTLKLAVAKGERARVVVVRARHR
jgi:hypothetical protein